MNTETEMKKVDTGAKTKKAKTGADPDELERTCSCSSQTWSGGHVCRSFLGAKEVICDLCMPCTDDRCATGVQRVGPQGVEWIATADHCIEMCPLD